MIKSETSDRVQLTLANGDSYIGSTCRDKDTRKWFKTAKERAEDRMGVDLTHEEFTRLLLWIFEYHEEEEVPA